jgi:hypothetical protein
LGAVFDRSGISIHTSPPTAYTDWVNTSGAFFDGEIWGDVLQAGFGSQRWYLWDADHALGQALTVFRKGPLRIGYLGFPICAGPTIDTTPYALDAMVQAIRKHSSRPQILRVPISAFGMRTLQASRRQHSLLESCIVDLSAWRSDATSARRRDLAFAKRRCAAYTKTSTTGADLHLLYQAAIARNRGHSRYNRAYFERLADTAKSGVCVHSYSNNGRALGMAITAQHGETTYHLHGGADPIALGSGVADLLLAEAIAAAQARGSRQFNFLSSPVHQQGLVRFKQKWGGATREAFSHDVATSATGSLLLRLL